MSRFLFLLFLTLILLAAVYRLDNRAFIPSDTPRKPYLQQVQGDSALVCWRRVSTNIPQKVEWRVNGTSEWNTVEEVLQEEGPGPVYNFTSRLGPLPPDARVEYRVLAADLILGQGTFIPPKQLTLQTLSRFGCWATAVPESVSSTMS